jgi:predicted RNase H-like HicB family nuclease
LRNARVWQEATLKYKIVMKKSEEGYSVSCPGLPGCWSQGETEEEAIKNILSAIQEYLVAIDDFL